MVCLQVSSLFFKWSKQVRSFLCRSAKESQSHVWIQFSINISSFAYASATQLSPLSPCLETGDNIHRISLYLLQSRRQGILEEISGCWKLLSWKGLFSSILVKLWWKAYMTLNFIFMEVNIERLIWGTFCGNFLSEFLPEDCWEGVAKRNNFFFFIFYSWSLNHGLSSNKPHIPPTLLRQFNS